MSSELIGVIKIDLAGLGEEELAALRTLLCSARRNQAMAAMHALEAEEYESATHASDRVTGLSRAIETVDAWID